jgi:glucose-1-phosphate adenylyltransferase
VSMGIYVFDTDVLVEALQKDAADGDSGHSIGGDIIPRLVRERTAHVYDFRQNTVPGAEPRDAGYWREVGTLDSYFDAHMDLCAIHPAFNLYNRRWPILTHVPPDPPAKFVHDDDGRVGRAIDSVVSNGVIVSGGLVRNSVLSPGVRVDSSARVNRAVLLHNSHVSRCAVVENAILDKNVVIQEGATVGVDKNHDRARGLTVSKGGITVVGKGQIVPRLMVSWQACMCLAVGGQPGESGPGRRSTNSIHAASGGRRGRFRGWLRRGSRSAGGRGGGS